VVNSGILQVLPPRTQVTVLATISAEAHTSSSHTTLAGDAYEEIAAFWEDSLAAANGPALRVELVYFPLHMCPIAGSGFRLHLGDGIRSLLNRDISAAVTNDQERIREVFFSLFCAL
jgi:hypothetical protein